VLEMLMGKVNASPRHFPYVSTTVDAFRAAHDWWRLPQYGSVSGLGVQECLNTMRALCCKYYHRLEEFTEDIGVTEMTRDEHSSLLCFLTEACTGWYVSYDTSLGSAF
jgi:hypothetical protein